MKRCILPFLTNVCHHTLNSLSFTYNMVWDTDRLMKHNLFEGILLDTELTLQSIFMDSGIMDCDIQRSQSRLWHSLSEI